MLTPNITCHGKTILVTGAAGFIGANLIVKMLKTVNQAHIVGIDNMNDYYDVNLKKSRLEQIESTAHENPPTRWTFVRGDISNANLVKELFLNHKFSLVINLAALAGVRYSI